MLCLVSLFKPVTDEQFFLDKFYLLVCTYEIFLTRFSLALITCLCELIVKQVFLAMSYIRASFAIW